jgi:hypothetical protein
MALIWCRSQITATGRRLVVPREEDWMSLSTARWARWVMAATAGIFALSVAMEVLGGDESVSPKMLRLESL